jgi:hypothetical protein
MTTNVVRDLVIFQDGPATWPVTEIGMDPQRRIHAFGRWAAGNAHRCNPRKVCHEQVLTYAILVLELPSMFFHVALRASERALGAKPLQVIIAHPAHPLFRHISPPPSLQIR